MTIYVPCYDYGHKVVALNTNEIRTTKSHGYDRNIFHRGMIYNGENAFTTLEAAEAYWRKETWNANKFRYNWEQ